MVAAADPWSRAEREYPSSLAEFLEWFPDEASCWRYLVRLRWPDGFSCPACGHNDAWLTERYLFVCTACRHHTSVTAGTLFQDSRLPLLTWFRAAWLITSQKNGVSAKSLQRELGLGSYKSAWTLHHKLRTAMVRPDQDRLRGEIEVDETFVGGPRSGKRGRGSMGKQIVIIAVEKPTGHVKYGFGRARMRVIPNCAAKTLLGFIEDTCEWDSVIYTDGLKAYEGVADIGYSHQATAVSQTDDPAHVALPAVHRVASLFKRWLLGTHQGGIAKQHLDYYLDEFVFRFNRRNAKARGLLFYRLLQIAVEVKPTTWDSIVWARRPDADQTAIRGPKRKNPHFPPPTP